MLKSLCIVLLFYLSILVNASPIVNQHALKKPSLQQSWYQTKEYEIYSAIIEHYENVVDRTLGSESEELFYSLIHLPRQKLNEKLSLQAKLIGIDIPSEKQLMKMTTIISKHIEMMNNRLYAMVEYSVTAHRQAIGSAWNPKTLQDKIQLVSFLSSINAYVAKSLTEEMSQYLLLEKVKQDIELIDGKTSILIWFKESLSNYYYYYYFLTAPIEEEEEIPDIEIDFLRQYLHNIRSNLFIELDNQFIDLFNTLQSLL